MSTRFVHVLEENVAYGTKAVAWPTGVKPLPFLEWGVQPNNNMEIVQESLYQQPELATFGGFVSVGDLKMLARPDNMGLLLKWLYNGYGYVVGPPNVHTYTPAAAADSFSMALATGKSINALTHLGCVVKSLTLEATGRGPAIATWNIQVQNEDNAVAVAALGTVPLVRPFQLYDATVVSTLGNVQKAESIRITIERTVPDDAHASGSRLLPDISDEGFSITGELEIRFDDWEEREDFYGGVASTSPNDEPLYGNVSIDFTGVTTGLYELLFDLPTCVITDNPLNLTGRNRQMQRIGFQALYNVANTCILKNADTTYA